MIKLMAPEFAWAFLLPAGILALYLLRRKFQPRRVPSTFLWRKSLQDAVANRPFQKLKKNLLLPIQLLAALLLALALTRPAFTGGAVGRTILVLDASGSMQTRSDGVTRLDQAKARAAETIRALPAGEEITILSASSDVRREALNTTDPEQAIRALQAIQPTREKADWDKALSLARAIAQEGGEEERSAQIIAFSDALILQEENTLPITIINIGHAEDNRAITAITAEPGQAWARIANYGASCVLSLTCHADDRLVQARQVEIPAGETAGVSFSLPEDAQKVRITIRESDALLSDNQAEAPVQSSATRQVALVGSENLFLESALKLRPDLVVLRTEEEALATVQADLYIRGDGPVIFSTHPDSTVITWPDLPVEASGSPESVDDPLTAGVSLRDFALRRYYPLTGGRALWTLGQDVLLARSEGEIVLGFDLHDSNLPMKYGFPILVQKILSSLLPESDPADAEGLLLPMPAEESDVRLVAVSSSPAEARQATGQVGADATVWLLAALLVLLLVEMGVSRFVC